MNTFQSTIQELARRRMRSLMRHRERYIKAWIAATGIHPLDCILIERIAGDGDGTVTIEVMRRSDWEARNAPTEPGTHSVSRPDPAGAGPVLQRLTSKCICPFGTLLGDCPEHGYLVPV